MKKENRHAHPVRGRKQGPQFTCTWIPDEGNNHNPRKGTKPQHICFNPRDSHEVKNHNPRKGTETTLGFSRVWLLWLGNYVFFGFVFTRSWKQNRFVMAGTIFFVLGKNLNPWDGLLGLSWGFLLFGAFVVVQWFDKVQRKKYTWDKSR